MLKVKLKRLLRTGTYTCFAERVGLYQDARDDVVQIQW